jgi:hypothetical protein
MAGIRGSTGCINHPGVEAVARCRQCGKPVCGACVVIVLSGKFCGEECRERYENFLERAQKLDVKKGFRAGMFARFRRLVMRAVVIAAALLLLGTVLTYFNILEIPFLRLIIDQFANR